MIDIWQNKLTASPQMLEKRCSLVWEFQKKSKTMLSHWGEGTKEQDCGKDKEKEERYLYKGWVLTDWKEDGLCYLLNTQGDRDISEVRLNDEKLPVYLSREEKSPEDTDHPVFAPRSGMYDMTSVLHRGVNELQVIAFEPLTTSCLAKLKVQIYFEE